MSCATRVMIPTTSASTRLKGKMKCCFLSCRRLRMRTSVVVDNDKASPSPHCRNRRSTSLPRFSHMTAAKSVTVGLSTVVEVYLCPPPAFKWYVKEIYQWSIVPSNKWESYEIELGAPNTILNCLRFSAEPRPESHCRITRGGSGLT